MPLTRNEEFKGWRLGGGLLLQTTTLVKVFYLMVNGVSTLLEFSSDGECAIYVSKIFSLILTATVISAVPDCGWGYNYHI